MSELLRGIITEKLSTAAREIVSVVERTVSDYEEEAAAFRQELERRRSQLELLHRHRGDKHNKRALVPELYSHEVVVVSEEQTDAEEGEILSWSRDDYDEDDEGNQPPTTSKEDPKVPEGPTPPSSRSEPLSISKVNTLRDLISEKLSTAAQEILEVVGRTAASAEEAQAAGFRQELERQRRQLELLQPRVTLHRGGVEVVVDEEPEEQTDVEEAESQSLPWSPHEEEDKKPPTISTQNQVDLKDPDYEAAPRSVPSVRKRSSSLQISDLQNHLNLKIRLLEDSTVQVLSPAVFKKSPVRELRCCRGLQEADFLNILRSTFPQLANDEPFDVFITDQSRKLRPLNVKTLTPEEIHSTIMSTGNSALYVRLKRRKQKQEEQTEPRMKEEKPDGTELHTGTAVESGSSTPPQDMGPEEEEAENMESGDGGAEVLDGGHKRKRGPGRQIKKQAVKKRAKKRAKVEMKKTKDSKMFCKVCGVWYRFQGSLIKHAWSHVDEQRDICGVCGEKSESMEELKEHLRSYKNVHSCSDCGKTFVSVLSLQCHIAKHTGNSRFKCKFCNKAFTNQASLKTHCWSHVEEKPHKCDICLKTFGLKAQLAVHIKKHTSEDQYQCDFCEKTFNLRRSLTQHRLIHSEERHYACAICDKRFKLEGSLKTHMKIHEDRDRSFLCHVCCKTFLSKSSLMVHIKVHSAEKQFACDTCGKRFTVSYDLKKHMRIHTGETPYHCPECGRSFRQKTNLDSHVKIHLGIKQFVCEVCEKACSRREHLKVHMRTHNGERPYRCTLCDKTFTQTHCLKTHMKSHDADGTSVPGDQIDENPDLSES